MKVNLTVEIPDGDYCGACQFVDGEFGYCHLFCVEEIPTVAGYMSPLMVNDKSDYEKLAKCKALKAEPKPLQSLEEHNKQISQAVASFNQPRKNGIACPKCGQELYDSNPSEVLASFPPKHAVYCDCGYKGYRLG